ncbi:hypothetical protein SAMN05192545_1949 [Maribacter dokdonensis]|uniref:asparagine synthase (glutamine-hydrolyzing) n=1 Tax=Maribacter dokdonensis TaxID=320912 RepID=A0ABY0UIG3_9FLAO|nr:hypothetical protein [Maribacter dokdonensis]SDS73288.1 hypothetical protein SAMN05192545_1949 [Maribacter dokdonensis]
MDNLKFRRQFLLSPKLVEELSNWQVRKFGKSYLHVHPDLELNYVEIGNKTLILLGYWLSPHFCDKTNKDLLVEITKQVTYEKDFIEFLNKLVGRFVLIIKINDSFKVFHDACGLRTVYYSVNNNGIHLASQPELFKLIFSLVGNKERTEYFNSDYVKKTKEHWLPCGITLYNSVHQLLPNFYYNSDSNNQIRYWPNINQPIKTRTPEDGVKVMVDLMTKTMNCANVRFDIALAMTAGLDSRLLLSATKKISKDIFFYTLKYRNLTINSVDIKIPNTILTKLGFEHKVIDCTKKAEIQFLECYQNNTSNSHLDDWGTIASGIHKGFPKNRVAVRGNCVEIGRSAYFQKLKVNGDIKPDQLIGIVPGWRDLCFLNEYLSNWLKGVKQFEKYGYDIRDLFYMEHRVGSWQAQSQLEWDIAQEIFVPFNNREIIEVMLSVDSQYRNKQNYSFFTEAINLLWPEVLSEPINPISSKQRIRGFIKSILKSVGLFKMIKS